MFPFTTTLEKILALVPKLPVEFHILTQHNLVYIRYDGYIRVDDSIRAFSEYTQHPDFCFGQHQLIDLSLVTNFERDFTKIITHQAQQVDVYIKAKNPPILAFLAPSKASYRMAKAAVRSWDQLDCVIPLVLSNENEALEVLGLADKNLTELLKAIS